MKIAGANKLRIDRKEILKLISQEEIFKLITNYYPEVDVPKYYSLFREDKTPDCRYTWKKGVLYFVDNAGFNGKVFFNCFDAVMAANNLSFQEALQFINSNITKGTRIKTKKIPETLITNIDIRFTFKPWTEENNTFFSKWGITHEHLIDDNTTFLVDNYWTTTKLEPILRVNRFGEPNDKVIAYLCGEKVKLYFHSRNKGSKFFTNCSNEVFNIEKLDSYLYTRKKKIIISKAKKDCLFLHYVADIPCLGIQHESIIIDDKIIQTLKKNNITIYTMFDNDNTGVTLNNKYKQLYGTIPIQIPSVNNSTDIPELVEETSIETVKTFLNNEIYIKS